MFLFFTNQNSTATLFAVLHFFFTLVLFALPCCFVAFGLINHSTRNWGTDRQTEALYYYYWY